MKYSIKYITAIAEYTLGNGSASAIADYVKKFDPTLPKFIADEKRFLTDVENDKKISEQRQKLRETNFVVDNFIYDFYRKDLFLALQFNKGNKGIDNKKFDLFNTWLKDAILTERKEVDKSLSYAENANKFMDKYGINVNVDSIVSSVQGIAISGNKHWTYANYYKLLFQAYYKQVNKDDVKIEEFAKDFDEMLSSVRVAETGKNGIPPMNKYDYKYGVMKSKDLQKFLFGIKEEECNYYKQAKDVAVGVKNEEVADLYKNLINAKLEAEDCSKENQLRYCMAHVKALKEHFQSRPVLYKITSFFIARKEANTIAEMQKLMVEKFGPDKVAEFSDVKDIYSENFQKDSEGIDKFCDELDRKELENDTKFEISIDDEVKIDETEKVATFENENTLAKDPEIEQADGEMKFGK